MKMAHLTTCPSKMGNSNRTIIYRCTRCGAEPGRDNLTIKQAQFKTMDGKIKKTRVSDWLCPKCLAADPDENLPARSKSPGMKDTKLASTG